MDINKDVACEQALIGDAKLVLEALLGELEFQVAPRDPASVADEIKAVREPWLAEWRPKATSGRRVPASTRIASSPTSHARSTRTTPSSLTTPAARATSFGRLGVDDAALVHRLGQDHAARLWPRARHGREAGPPDKAARINVGDAASGFTGMDFETAVRERIPILWILLNNFLHGDRAQGHAGLDRALPVRPTSR